jgi:hypothetical protein
LAPHPRDPPGLAGFAVARAAPAGRSELPIAAGEDPGLKSRSSLPWRAVPGNRRKYAKRTKAASTPATLAELMRRADRMRTRTKTTVQQMQALRKEIRRALESQQESDG